jgi:hypothetical protein
MSCKRSVQLARHTFGQYAEPMKDMDAVRYNEKVKRLSTLLGAGGLALVLTALTRLLDRDLDMTTGAWILAGVFLIWASVQLNEVLQPEDNQ